MDDNTHLNLQYVATLREQLEQLAEERTPEGLPRSVCSSLPLLLPLVQRLVLYLWCKFILTSLCRVSKAMVNDYSEKIEAIASKLAAPLVCAYWLASLPVDIVDTKYYGNIKRLIFLLCPFLEEIKTHLLVGRLDETDPTTWIKFG